MIIISHFRIQSYHHSILQVEKPNLATISTIHLLDPPTPLLLTFHPFLHLSFLLIFIPFPYSFSCLCNMLSTYSYISLLIFTLIYWNSKVKKYGFPPKREFTKLDSAFTHYLPQKKEKLSYNWAQEKFSNQCHWFRNKKRKKKKKNPIWRKYDFAFLIMAFPIQMLIAEHKFHGSVKPSRRSIWVRAWCIDPLNCKERWMVWMLKSWLWFWIMILYGGRRKIKLVWSYICSIHFGQLFQ